MFDVMIIGGGVSGISCALILGSSLNKAYAADKKIGIFTHQKSSNLQEALLNNAYGIVPGKTGAELLAESTQHLSDLYPDILQITNEKVLSVTGEAGNFTVTTNRESYQTKMIVVGIGWANTFMIEGLIQYVIPHKKAIPDKNRIQLSNDDHKVAEGIYAAGTLAGWRSQLSIAAGSGAAVATDIMTLWNNGNQSQSHDRTPKI